jgi:hypothetical protein
VKIHHGHWEHEKLVDQMREIAVGGVADDIASGDCDVHGSSEHLFAMLRDSRTGIPVWQSSGRADVVLRDFERWLSKWKPN